MSLFDLALIGSALAIAIAVYAGLRRPDRRARYALVGAAIVLGLFATLWILANALRGW